jgi:hypothetical protein
MQVALFKMQEPLQNKRGAYFFALNYFKRLVPLI